MNNVKLVSEKESIEKDKEKRKTENSSLWKRVEEQEKEVLKAMQDIADEVTEERNKIIKNITADDKNEFKKQKLEHEKKSNEKDKIMNEMVKMQTDNDLMREKIEIIDKEKKIHKNMKLFKVLVDEVKESEDPDECINKVNCEGSCNEVADAVKLHLMKKAGITRTCPQDKPLEKVMLKCEKCEFISQNKVYFTKHMNNHYEEESKIAKKARNISGQNKIKKPCSYFNNPNGCKKGNSCLWDHSDEAQAQSVKKIPKICQNKDTCTWKPRCKYVHPENGESLPVKQARVFSALQMSQGQSFHQAASKGHQGGSGSLGFGSPDIGRHPPGWTQIPPPTYQSPGQVMENIKKKIQEMMMNVIVPDLMCLSQFPNLGKK